MHREQAGLTGDLNPKVKVRKLSDESCTHADIVVHKTKEEREPVLQDALKRWLAACTHLNAKSVIGVQRECAPGGLDKLNLLADVFRGIAPSTSLKRVDAVEKMCKIFGIGVFPPDEAEMHKFCVSERNLDAPPSKLRSFMEAIKFCRRFLSMDRLGIVVNSRRCVGTTSSDVPHVVAQAEPLKIEELRLLHNVLQTGSQWGKVFAGAILFATYFISRRAYLMHADHIVVDRDDGQTIAFLEALTSNHIRLRKLFTGCKEVNKGRKVPTHSCKASCLSYCAKFGPDAVTRLQLGYHTSGDSGLHMVRTYSRDSLAEPLAELVSVLTDIRLMRFKPDCTRSGRFSAPLDASVPVIARPMPPQGREVKAGD